MVAWTMLTWIIAPILIFKIGFNGVAVASALIGTSTIIFPVLITKQFIHFGLLKNILVPAVACLPLAIFFSLTTPLVKNLALLAALLIVGGIIYGGVIFLLRGKKLANEIKNLWKK